VGKFAHPEVTSLAQTLDASGTERRGCGTFWASVRERIFCTSQLARWTATGLHQQSTNLMSLGFPDPFAVLFIVHLTRQTFLLAALPSLLLDCKPPPPWQVRKTCCNAFGFAK
jgi:hypothetical protein